jgi:hypothetical protein
MSGKPAGTKVWGTERLDWLQRRQRSSASISLVAQALYLQHTMPVPESTYMSSAASRIMLRTCCALHVLVPPGYAKHVKFGRLCDRLRECCF